MKLSDYIKDKPIKVISTKESLKDVNPFPCQEYKNHVLKIYKEMEINDDDLSYLAESKYEYEKIKEFYDDKISLEDLLTAVTVTCPPQGHCFGFGNCDKCRLREVQKENCDKCWCSFILGVGGF